MGVVGVDGGAAVVVVDKLVILSVLRCQCAFGVGRYLTGAFEIIAKLTGAFETSAMYARKPAILRVYDVKSRYFTGAIEHIAVFIALLKPSVM